MGPRLKDVEDPNTVVSHDIAGQPLQWGHVSRTWKTRASQGRQALPEPLASMGPRLKDVEDLVWRLLTELVTAASMGPRLKDVEDGGSWPS